MPISKIAIFAKKCDFFLQKLPFFTKKRAGYRSFCARIPINTPGSELYGPAKNHTSQLAQLVISKQIPFKQV